MNEIEKAIAVISNPSHWNDEAWNQGAIQSAKDTAITALREQTERGKGCNYCLQTWPDRAAAGVSDIWHGNKLGVGYGVYREIKFCPMCGKRLEVEP